MNLVSVACALCGETEACLVERKATPTGERLSIVRCARCRLVYVSPRPRPEQLAELYRKSGYYEAASSIVGYQDYVGDRDVHEIFFSRQLDAIERHVKPGRLLDVGCAVGFLLDVARRRGWNTVGVEPSEFASDYARRELGLDVRTVTLPEAGFADGEFDAIVMDDVIEHLCHPERELREVARILKPGGVALVRTPNIASPWYTLTRRHWVHLKPGEHLYYFSPRTLKALVRRAGLAKVWWRPSGRTTHVRYMLSRVKYFSGPLARTLTAAAMAIPGTGVPFDFRSGELEMLVRRR